MFEHLRAAFQGEEPGHGNLGHLVQAHPNSLWKEFLTFFPDLSTLDSNLSRSVWRCNLSQTACRRTFLEFVNESTARDALEALPLTKFWSKMSELHPYVADVPVRASLMFPSTYVADVPVTTSTYVADVPVTTSIYVADVPVTTSKYVANVPVTTLLMFPSTYLC